jgi:subtilisin-like proprotein convertase family protein
MRCRLTHLGIAGLAVAALSMATASAAAAKTVTKTATFNQCLGTSTPIPSNGSNAASINLPVPKNGKKIQSGIVTGVSAVGVRLTGRVGDFSLNLVSPGGVAISLAVERDGSGSGYGTGDASCSGSLVQFTDGAATPISDPGNTVPNPIVGTFKPEQPLSTFVGGPARGPWTLVVNDDSSTRTGVLNAFSLNLTYTYKKPVKKKKK